MQTVLFALLLASIRNGTVLLDSCAPDCSSSSPSNKVPDPTNCNRFYYCLEDGNPSDFYEECPDGQKFDKNTNECVPEGNEDCASCDPACKFECPEVIVGTELVANPNDCNAFILCTSNGPLPLTCEPEKPFFNGTTCTDDPDQCCDPCQVFCDKKYIEIPDPFNCTNYYYCSERGFPTQEDLYHCPEERIFNATSGHCERDAMCTPQCYMSDPSKKTNEAKESCNDRFLCQATGYFPACEESCDPRYFLCRSENIGHTIMPIYCTQGLVFNPLTKHCVFPMNCPFQARI